MSDQTAVVFKGDDETALSVTSTRDVTDLLRFALEKGCDPVAMEKLVSLHERISDRVAATEFAESLAAFQNDCPVIKKTRTAKIVTGSGGSFEYTYADLNDIVRVVRPLLYARGFAFTFDSEVRDKLMVCTCTLRHVNGHSEKASFTAPVESKAGMSEQQKYSSALSYAKRVSLVEVLGITSVDPDEDGAAMDPITPAQVETLKALAKEVGADEKAFLAYIGYDSLESIQQRHYKTATLALEQKRRKAAR
jgi:hypothetical protein